MRTINSVFLTYHEIIKGYSTLLTALMVQNNTLFEDEKLHDMCSLAVTSQHSLCKC